MAQVDFQHREIAIKLVYYGPALSGKTTNLQKIHERMDPKRRGRLLTLDTKEDRTLYFDLLPLAFKSASGVTCKVKLFTVPGQVLHNTTRKVVLQGCDGVAFIADSQIAETKNNNESFANLRQNLKENRLDQENIPIVIQFNKRDLPDSKTDAELQETRARGKEPVIGAVAIRGEGVLETLYAVLQLAYRKMDEQAGLSRNIGLTEAEFLKLIFARMDLDGTQVGEWLANGEGTR
jgi:signal recognition particle receptor subunit beta